MKHAFKLAISLLIISVCFYFSSCGDDSTDNGTGTGTGSGTGTGGEGNWIPLTDGSYWKYSGETDITFMGLPVHIKLEYTLRVVRDTLVEGSTICKIVDETEIITTNFSGNTYIDTIYDHDYIGKDNTYYRSKGDDESTNFSDWEGFFECTPKQGDSWQCDPQDPDYTARILSFETVTNKTGKGNDFTNCAKTEYVTEGEENTYAWYCKDIGIVKQSAIYTLEESSEKKVVTLDLIEYEVK
ncbi:MAG: hypothetical protein JXA60_02655 [Candidatus Coatesbacteria bacterium]|nr:hypothetical protein [Candidatus Coatesbacteria bacterium]